MGLICHEVFISCFVRIHLWNIIRFFSRLTLQRFCIMFQLGCLAWQLDKQADVSRRRRILVLVCFSALDPILENSVRYWLWISVNPGTHMWLSSGRHDVARVESSPWINYIGCFICAREKRVNNTPEVISRLSSLPDVFSLDLCQERTNE